ncbi:MAG: hypothetical protein K6E53_13000, partial [Lachnospiraceae bacterium]|nr:hypothetical protein [Lachnospiraceae bacterium]
MIFNRAFKELFHEILYEEGYKYIAKWGRFIKVYNDELIYSVGHRMIPAIYKGKKCFTITSGIRTIYFESIDKWVFESTEHDLQMYSPTLDWLQFAYDESDIYDVVKSACLQFDELVAPVFNAVNDLKSYIAYAKKYQINVLHYGDKMLFIYRNTPLRYFVKYKWDISKDTLSEVNAYMSYKKNEYKLIITGSGDMVDFSAENNRCAWTEFQDMTLGWLYNLGTVEIG